MYSFDSRIRYSETDSEEKLSLRGLVNYFQDCSTFQSEELGVGIKYLKEKHLVWVVSAWQIDIISCPVLSDEVRIGTFPYDFRGAIGYRNFFMSTVKGEMLAKANSFWALLDTQTMHPVKATEEMHERYVLEERLDMDYAPRRISWDGTGTQGESFVVARSSLDSNGHVNNAQYVAWAENYLDRGMRPTRLRVEYKKQALLGDTVIPIIKKEDNRTTVVLCSEDKQVFSTVEFSVTTQQAQA